MIEILGSKLYSQINFLVNAKYFADISRFRSKCVQCSETYIAVLKMLLIMGGYKRRNVVIAMDSFIFLH